MTKIASVTMTGDCAEIIGDALRSVVDQVDVCVVIDTRTLIVDGTLDVAEMVCGKKLRIVRKPWKDDFGRMRTAALELAARHADWAIWVDTDERIVAEPNGVRTLVETVGELADSVSCWHISGEYAKERLIRLPPCGKYHGMTHEFWKPAVEGRSGRSQHMVRFDELPKSPEQLKAKLERDIVQLIEMQESEPDEPRWAYYKGDALVLLDRKHEAVPCFIDAMNAESGFLELRGWAAFRAADLIISGGDPLSGRQIACHGLSLCPYPELLWAAAAASLVLEDYGNAVIWAMLCVSAGNYAGFGKAMTRSGHVFPPAMYEGPWDIIARAHEQMGMEQEAKDARANWEAAKAMREAA